MHTAIEVLTIVGQIAGALIIFIGLSKERYYDVVRTGATIVMVAVFIEAMLDPGVTNVIKVVASTSCFTVVWMLYLINNKWTLTPKTDTKL